MAVDPVAYWEQADLEDRLSRATVLQVLDDDEDGEVDAGPLERLQADSAGKVESYLRPVYDLDLVRTAPSREVKRLALDVAVAMLALRHPEHVRRNGLELMAVAEKDLMRLRRSETRLDTTEPPDPPANVGGIVRSGDPEDPDPKPKFFLDGMGDF